MILWQSIINDIQRVSGQTFSLKQQQSLAGGSINAAYRLVGDKGERYFVKVNATGKRAMFDAEAKALSVIAASHTLKVPAPICVGDDGTQSYIVLQYLEMSGDADQVLLGEQLAAMHRVTQEKFGWDCDNTIGATHQPNAYQDSWLVFWRDQRLAYQLRLAAENNYCGDLQVLGEKLLVAMPVLFDGHDVRPSLLHGDLWGGNVAGLSDGTPVIFDPALYYGDRETDIAMTYVFGGFSRDFYASYQANWPLDEGFELRKTFYNIYHIINHLNLFGGGYHGQCIHMMEQVLAEIS